ncbi:MULTISPECIES: hypothetical protein [unclassified Pedobacter]|uniref:hypothetical protein n=1 Tax=unclassified Pedobacter TaxID=2628915 RepID=UPI001DA665F1|nr:MULTISPECIES: hypothetical protein [unclassified Pedobacter]CAH0265482.1 hypothetical protein SRABI36_03585 [Pedobacter sp. Bi36]CAH0291893.1 hypothetical protein SRABI126_04079 [Pedobacter sp. Bi126]
MKSSWVPKRKINRIKAIFESADERTRQDFELGMAANERDYLSRFLTLANYPTQTKGKKCEGLFMAQCATDTIERKHGVDAVMVFKHNDEFKIAFFECKIEKWDFDNGRFVKQLKKQRKLEMKYKGIVCFEMFFHKGSSLPFSDKLSSICTLKQLDAFVRDTSRETLIKWLHADLVALFEWLRLKHSGIYSIGNLIEAILSCHLGIIYSHPYMMISDDKPEFVQETILVAERLEHKQAGELSVSEYGAKYGIAAIGYVDLDSHFLDKTKST